MNKHLLAKTCFAAVLAALITPALSATQQDKTSIDVEQMQQTVALQASKIDNLERQNQALSTELQTAIDDNTRYDKKLTEQINSLQQDYKKQIQVINEEVNSTNKVVADLQSTTQNSDKNLQDTLKKLSDHTEKSTSALNKDIDNRSLAALLSLIGLLALVGAIIWYLRSKQNQHKDSLQSNIQTALNTVQQAEDTIVAADTQLIAQLTEVLSRIDLQQKKLAEMAFISDNNPLISADEATVEHGLAITLADEIHRMRRRIAALPEATKGLKSLSKSLERLEEALAEKGYEIIDYLGVAFSESMTIKARFIPSDELDEGVSVITKVVYPQVNYQEKLIRKADVEVSVG